MDMAKWAHESPIYQQTVERQGFDPLLQRAGRELGRMIARKIAPAVNHLTALGVLKR